MENFYANLYAPLPISPEAVLKLAEYSQLAQVVAAACRLQIFEALTGWLSVNDLARQKNLDAVTTARLLEVLKHLGYVEGSNGLYKNAAVAEAFLRPNKLLYLGHDFAPDFPAGSLGEQLMRSLKKAPAGPDAAGAKNSGRDWDVEHLKRIGAFSLTGSIQATLAAVDLSGAKHLLDLGGGHGFYSVAAAQKYPALSVTLFDLPQIVALAKENVAAFHLGSRLKLVAGNFLQDDIGTGYDAVLCANILHPANQAVVLPKVRQALNRSGQIIVKCRIADCPDTPSNALAKLIWQVRGGKVLLPQSEWHQLLAGHGFLNVKTVNVYKIFATITGQK